jgi:hypothetical protein
MRRSIGSFALCLIILCACGCLRGPITWQRLTLNQPITQEQVRFIKNGETRLDDVAKELGAPDEILNLKNRLVARYHFLDSKYFRVDFGWGLRFVIPYYAPDLVLGGGGAATDVFEVACDPQLVVQEFSFAFHQNSSRFRLWPYGD